MKCRRTFIFSFGILGLTLPTRAHQNEPAMAAEAVGQAPLRSTEQRTLDKLSEKLAQRFAKILTCSGAYQNKSEDNRRWADVAEMKAALKEWKAAIITHKLVPKSHRDIRFNEFLRDEVEKRGLRSNRNFSRWIDGDPDIDTLLASSGEAIGNLELRKDDGKTLASTLSAKTDLIDQWNTKWNGYVQKAAVFGSNPRSCAQKTRLSEPIVDVNAAEIAAAKAEFDSAEKERAKLTQASTPPPTKAAAAAETLPIIAKMSAPETEETPTWLSRSQLMNRLNSEKRAYLDKLVKLYTRSANLESSFDTIRHDYQRFEDNPWQTTERLVNDVASYQELIDESSEELADYEIALRGASPGQRQSRVDYWRGRSGDERWKAYEALQKERPVLELVRLEFSSDELRKAGEIDAPKNANDEEKIKYGELYFMRSYKSHSESQVQNRIARLREKALAATIDTSGDDASAAE